MLGAKLLLPVFIQFQYWRKKEYFWGKYRVNRGRPWPRKLYIGVAECPSVQFPQKPQIQPSLPPQLCGLWTKWANFNWWPRRALLSNETWSKPGQLMYRVEQGNWQLQVKTKPTNRFFRLFYFSFESSSLVCISLEAVDFVRRVVWVLPYKPNIGISDGSEQGDLQKTNIMTMTWKIWEQKSSCMIIGPSSH